jgi:hypothetical protein
MTCPTCQNTIVHIVEWYGNFYWCPVCRAEVIPFEKPAQEPERNTIVESHVKIVREGNKILIERTDDPQKPWHEITVGATDKIEREVKKILEAIIEISHQVEIGETDRFNEKFKTNLKA